MIHLPTRIPRPRDEHDNHAAIPVAGSGSVRKMNCAGSPTRSKMKIYSNSKEACFHLNAAYCKLLNCKHSINIYTFYRHAIN